MPKKQQQRIIDARRAVMTSMYGITGGNGNLPITQEDKFHKYATTVVAAHDSYDMDKDWADYVCDGAHDEEQISDALAAGGRVILLDGTYNISYPINMRHDVEIVGSGPGKCSIRNAGTLATFFSPTLINHFGLKDIRLDCFPPIVTLNHINAPLLRCHFENVVFSGTTSPAVYSAAAERVRFYDCEFRDCNAGIEISDADEVEVLKCRFYKCGYVAVDLAHPARCNIASNTFMYCSDCVVLKDY